jgi:hypothetical protein
MQPAYWQNLLFCSAMGSLPRLMVHWHSCVRAIVVGNAEIIEHRCQLVFFIFIRLIIFLCVSCVDTYGARGDLALEFRLISCQFNTKSPSSPLSPFFQRGRCGTELMARSCVDTYARGGLPFLNGQERKQRRPPHETRRPLRCGQSSRRQAGFARSSLPGRNPAPLVPRSGVFQGDFKKPYAKSVVITLFHCLLMQKQTN